MCKNWLSLSHEWFCDWCLSQETGEALNLCSYFVSCSHLNSSFTQIQSESQFFSRKDIRIMWFFKSSLQLMQLKSSKCCPTSSNFFPAFILTIISFTRCHSNSLWSFFFLLIDSNVTVIINDNILKFVLLSFLATKRRRRWTGWRRWSGNWRRRWGRNACCCLVVGAGDDGICPLILLSFLLFLWFFFMPSCWCQAVCLEGNEKRDKRDQVNGHHFMMIIQSNFKFLTWISK